MESEAYRRVVNALTDVGYHVTPVNEYTLKFGFNGWEALVTVSPPTPLKGKVLSYPWKEQVLWQNESGSELI